MDKPPLNDRIVAAFAAMSPQRRKAARYVLDQPRDVALLSMREQARRAGVEPATMTRLAKSLGLAGYEEVRALYAAAVREGGFGFAGGAGAQAARQKQKGDKGLAADMLEAISRQIAQLAAGDGPERLAAAARALAAARRVYCLGLRSSHAPAWQLHYVLALISERSVFLDSPAAVGTDALAHAGPKDALFVVSVRPYTRLTVETAAYAASRGVAVVALTDSEVAPLAAVARHVVLAPTDSPSFFHALSPAFALAEVLAALVAGRGGAAALSALREKDLHLAALDTHLQSQPLRESP